MKRVGWIVVPVVVVLGLIVTGWLLLRQASFPVLQPSGWVAKQEVGLLQFALILTIIVVVPVFTMLVLFAVRYREGNKRARYRPEWHKSAWLEIIWWGLPVVIIAILGVVTFVSTHQLDPYKPLQSTQKTMNVQVVALQWKWLFLYPDDGIASVNELRIPVGTPVTFSLTADAPMSAFWVPSLGSQIYSMNGMTSQVNLVADDAGVYDGYNTNINGAGYADMTFKVHALPVNTYGSWRQAAQNSPLTMDGAQYEQIAKPGTSQPATYRLEDRKLYDTIVMKYMKHDAAASHGEHTTSEETTHE